MTNGLVIYRWDSSTGTWVAVGRPPRSDSTPVDTSQYLDTYGDTY